MKRTVVGLLFVALLASVALVEGCGDDNNPTEPTDTTQTQLPDANVMFVRDVVEDNATNSFEMDFDVSFALLDSLSAAKSLSANRHRLSTVLSPEDQDVIITNFTLTTPAPSDSGWYEFHFGARIVEDLTNTLEINGIDSVRLLLNENWVPWEGDLTDFNGIQARVHVGWAHSDGQNGGAHHTMDVFIDTQGADSVATIDATVNDTINGFDETDRVVCQYAISNNSLIDSLVIRINEDSDDCPSHGTITASASIDLDCASQGGLAVLDIEGTWSLTATVNADSTITFDYSDGTTDWSFTSPCDSL